MALVGLLPAAGLGTRLAPYRSPKELFPFLLATDDGPRPSPVAQFTLDAMRVAGVDRCIAVISDRKGETLRVLSDGRDYGVRLGYVVQPKPLGLTDVVRCAAPWIANEDVVFGMPDTVVFPQDVLRTIYERLTEASADIVLAVFPTKEPERLAPVDHDAAGNVRAIHDKPAQTNLRNTWGALAWSPRFTEFCCEDDAPMNLSHAMEAARRRGMKVQAHAFGDGIFADLGTPAGLGETIALLQARGLIYAPGT